jgi:hypothetical protein
LFGHDDLMRWSKERMYLECFNCGRQTAGWNAGKTQQGEKGATMFNRFNTKAMRLAFAVALVAGLSAPAAFAQTLDKRTLFSFSGPITMPGVTLPAGQYLFRLADPTSGRTVVQVLSADGSKPYGMFFSYPAERLEASSQPEVRFMETPAGAPAAIKTWWYPGERTGYEFIYPKDQARRLAQGASQPVLTTELATTTAAQTNTADLARVSSTGQETNVSAETAPTAAAPTGTTHEGTVASSTLSIPNSSIPAAPASVHAAADKPAATTASARRTELPRTASSIPLAGATAIVSLAGGLAVYVWRKRTARA